MRPMPRPRPKYLHRQVTRHGATVWYVRIGKGPRIRINEPYGSQAFSEAYGAAIAGKPKGTGAAKAVEGSLRWLLERYQMSAAWKRLSAATQRQRANIFRGVLDANGDEPYSAVTRRAIIDGRERRSSTPAQARHFVVAMRGLFKWAVSAEHCKEDPTEGILSPRPKTAGHHPWTQEECDAFEKRWKVGTMERLAYDVLLYTGLRRGDAAELGQRHVKRGVITIVTAKNGEVVIIPILPPLEASIKAASKPDAKTFILGGSGKPFSKEGFGNWFGKVCAKTEGVRGTAHGLRKAGATRAADNGATEAELEAIFGWRGGRMASLYTRQANRGRLAMKAASKLLAPKPIPSPKGEGGGTRANNGDITTP